MAANFSVRDPGPLTRFVVFNPVLSALVETLSFLSDNEYQFEFRPIENPPPVEGYFTFSGAEATRFTPDEVILFSGGLDSFAGTVQELVTHGKKVALVSHRSASKIHLVDQLRSRFGADRVFHIPVWANLDGSLGGEATHRTRSFLFAALGVVTAQLLDRHRIFFFENGVVSLNLPQVAQVVGARATRTTHPQVLAGFRRLLAEVLGGPFDVSNPFEWMTKAEVIERISANGCSDLIRHTRSCTRVHDMTTLHPHCGQCSQCVDRRFAVLAAGQEHEDPEEAYKVDLFLGERPAGLDRELVLAFVRSASAVNQMTDVAFFAHYGEASRAVGFYSEPAGTVAERIFDLHRRHAAAVCRVFDGAISLYAAKLREGSLSSSCLLSLVVAQQEADAATGYPERSQMKEQIITIRRQIRLAVDVNRKCVILNRWGEIKGVGAELLLFLASLHRQATSDEVAPERYPFAQTRDALRKLRIDSDRTLRRRVFRCRKQIEKLATDAGDPSPSLDDVIENHQWRGYRLNPDVIRIVALAELTSSRR